MQGPPPPLPNLEPIAAEVRTAEEDALHWLHHKQVQRDLHQAADVADKFYEAVKALEEDQEHQREQRKAQDEAVKWSPAKAEQQHRDERETRRRSRAERHR